MFKSPCQFRLIFTLLALSMTTTVHAGLLGTANDYNVFTLGNFTQSGTDAEGRVAVGGKFDPGGSVSGTATTGGGTYTVASNNPSSATLYNLVVGGNYQNGSTTINGNVVIGGTANSVSGTITGTLSVVGDLTRNSGQQGGNVTVGGNALYHTPSGSFTNITTTGNLTLDNGGYLNGGITHGGTFTNGNSYTPFSGINSHPNTPPAAPTVPINFANEATSLKTLSTNLNKQGSTANAVFTGNSATNTAGAFTLTGTNGTQDIFHIKGSDLALANSFTINGVTGETIVINISGAVDKLASFSFFENNINNQHVLFNFIEATSLTINSISVQGSLLAPLANINFAGGNINGTIIGNTITGGGESHDHQFLGNVTFDPSPLPTTSTPEPTTLVTGALGMIMAGVVAYRRRRSA